jgi:hypothetical protein
LLRVRDFVEQVILFLKNVGVTPERFLENKKMFSIWSHIQTVTCKDNIKRVTANLLEAFAACFGCISDHLCPIELKNNVMSFWNDLL